MDRKLLTKILIVCILSKTSNAQLFAKLEVYCSVTNTVYETLSNASKTQCALFCNTNSYGQCSRFIWDPVTNVCMLHSSTVYSGTNPFNIQAQIGWITYHLVNESK